MKLMLILVLIMSMLLGSCNIGSDISDNMKSPDYADNGNTTPGNSTQRNEAEDNKKDIVASAKTYQNFMELVISNKKPYELIDSLDREMEKVSREHTDEMLLALEEVQKVYESYYQQMFINSDKIGELNELYKEGLGTHIIEKIKSENLKALVSEVLKSGYKLVSVEGAVYPVVDYEYLKKYSSNASSKVADYISIMAADSENTAAVDAAVVISWDELSKRMLDIEEFINTNEGFARNGFLNYLYYKYMNMYLAGLNNTPAYERESNRYRDDVIQSFNNVVNNNKDSQTAGIVKQYLDIIKTDNYIYTEQAKKFVSDLYNQNISSEGKYKNTIDYAYVNQALTKLLPVKTGYRWLYNGFAEYGHQISLLEIINNNGVTTYEIEGKVADMSDGESGKDEDYFNIKLDYTIKNASIIQTKNENIMMDSEMDSLELIRAPLVKGNKWLQIAVDKSGNDRFLNCEITEINELEGSKVYTVEYRDQDSKYYEIRMIEEGTGVVAFSKLWDSGEDSFEIGYSLYKEASGYNESEK